MKGRPLFKFRLYVAGEAFNSAQAFTNLSAICGAYLQDQCKIEVVDIFREPKRAIADSVFMTPTLIKLAPAPVRRVVGTLSQMPILLQALGLEAYRSTNR